jgi:hypothetical protein
VAIGSSELGGEERSQEFRFGVFHIYCAAKMAAKTISEGAVSWPTSQIFATEVKFEKCLTKTNFEGFIAGTKTNFNVNPETKKSEPVKFVYHVKKDSAWAKVVSKKKPRKQHRRRESTKARWKRK